MNFSTVGTEDGWLDKYNHLMVDLRDPRYPHYHEQLRQPPHLLDLKVRCLPDDVLYLADNDHLHSLCFHL